MKFDLHVHSIYSDGNYSPKEIIDLAVEKDLFGISITDHDTLSGIDEAVKYTKKTNKIKLIPGIEFSCIHDEEEVHILGYLKDYTNSKILEKTKLLKEIRYERGLEIISKLNKIGMDIKYEDLSKVSKKDFIGRVAIAEALIMKGYINTIEEGFDKYLNRGKIGYVEKKRFSINEIINLIESVGGVSILAHPGLLKNKQTLRYCLEQGIDGIETFHSKHSKKDIKKFSQIAKKYNIIETAGSDCHGRLFDGDLLLGRYYIDVDKIPKLKEMII